jgi:HK97 family phage prohead protease
VTQKRTFTTATTALAKGDEPEILISTTALDRDRHEVVPEGADLTAYRRNPAVLFGHDMHALPVCSTTWLEIIPGRGIRARWRWLEGDDFANRVRNAFEQGVLRAASIGFLPTSSEPNGKGGRRFTAWELTEWSLVPVPSNPEAVRALKGLGLLDRDDVLLRLSDDEGEDDEPTFSAREVAEVLPGVLRECLRDAIRREATRAIQHARGRIPDDVVRDPFVRHHAGGASADQALVRQIIAQLAPSIIAGAVRDVPKTIRQELARCRGRVD